MKEPCAGEVHQSVGGLMMAGLMLALFIAALDSTVVATALPTISAALGGAAHYAWPMTAYLASSAVSTLLCGGLAFHFGLKRTYAFGLALFAAASALCAVAPTIEALAAFRLLQGIGGGLLEAGVFIAAAMMLPPRDRGPYLGVASAMYGVASVIGPVIGGAVAQGLSWHVIFAVNIPIAIVAFALSSSSLPGRGERSRATQFDAAGSVLASLSVLSLVAVFSLAGGAFPLASPQAAALIVLFVILTFVLYRIEAAASAPVIPMGLFGRPQVVAGFISGFCVQFALMAGVTYLPRLLQESMGVAAVSSGALFRKSGRLRAIALTSSSLVLAAATAFIVRAQGLTAPSVTLLATALGLGVGMGMPVSNLSAQTGADARDAGKATSTAMFFRGFGGTVSTAVCGMLAPVASPVGTAWTFCAVLASAVVGIAVSIPIARRISS